MNTSLVDFPPMLDGSTFVDNWTEGVAVLTDKPAGWSSFRVIRILRSYTGVRKIGHAGTLDPMATGLLICCIGRAATRTIDRFVGLDKVYEGTMRLGATTASYDAETPIEVERDAGHLSEQDVAEVFSLFEGRQLQKVPMYSAVKVHGQRLYKLARKHAEVDRPRRVVAIHEFVLLGKDGDDVRFRAVCSKGTYIRTLAHDVGQRLGVGAHLIALRRTAIGPYKVKNALRPESLETKD